jgi:hypothetical protein
MSSAPEPVDVAGLKLALYVVPEALTAEELSVMLLEVTVAACAIPGLNNTGSKPDVVSATALMKAT